MQKAKKAKVSKEERQLKRLGANKFDFAQSLDGGRNYLEARSNVDTTARNEEKLNAQNALALGSVDMLDNSGVNYNDTRLGGRAGIAARATAEEDSLGLKGAIIDADLGNSSAVSRSQRAAAESKMRLEETLVNNSMKNRALNNDMLGTVAGLGVTYGDKIFSSDLFTKGKVMNVDAGVGIDGRRVYRDVPVDTMDPLSRDFNTMPFGANPYMVS